MKAPIPNEASYDLIRNMLLSSFSIGMLEERSVRVTTRFAAHVYDRHVCNYAC
jgi:hypothetical protein